MMEKDMGRPVHTEADEGDEPPPPGVRAAAIIRWVVVAVAVLLAIWSVLAWSGVLPGTGDSAGGRGEHGASSRGDLYQCPMHPSIVSDRPGDCPICNMALVKVEQASTDVVTGGTSQVPGLATVTFTQDKIQKAGVVTAVVARRTISDPIRTVAIVSADESRIAKVQTRFSGWIEKLQVAETGQKVAKGQVLAEIFSRELFTAQQEYLNAIRWARGEAPQGAESLQKQARQRLELLGVAGPEVEAIEKRGEPLRALPIRSPMSGYVTSKVAIEGVFVDPGVELFEIADLSRVWAWAEIYERDLGRVRVGQPAKLTVASLPGETFEGKVTFLQPVVDPQSRTVRARIELPNPKLLLRPGLYGEVEIAAATREGLVIPRDALVDTGEHQYVFVEVEPMRFQPRLVKAGTRSGDEVLVLEGLSEGEKVVTRGNFLVDSESRLRASAAAAAKASAGKRTDIPIDEAKYPEKYQQWLECERVHRGMGTMEEDCKNTIPRPWK